MSTLIWILYLAEVVDALIFVLAFGGVLVAIVLSAVSGIQADEEPCGEELNKFVQLMRRRIIWPIAMILMACFLPSKELIYIATGLNVGKEVAESEIGQKSLTVLESWLDKAITEAEHAK